MRRAAFVIVIAVPAALLTVTAATADAGAGRPASPPPSGAPLTLQADVARKARPAALPATSHRGKRSRVIDAATPPSPGTAPAMSGSSPLTVAQDGARQPARVACGARAPPVSGRQASVQDGARLS